MLTSPVAEAYGFVRTPVADERRRARRASPTSRSSSPPPPYIGEGLVPPPGEGLTIGAILLRPRSRGTIRLASADPTAKAVIDPGYLTDPDGIDEATILAGLAECERLIDTDALRAVTTGGWIQPEGGERMTPEERAELSLRRYSHTIYHPVGTARMGSDAASVVDPELRVRGVAGSARRRRVGHADRHPRAHERPRDRHRRGRGGPDPRRVELTSAVRRPRPRRPVPKARRVTRHAGRRSPPPACRRHASGFGDRDRERRKGGPPLRESALRVTCGGSATACGGCRRSGARPSRP